MINIMEEKEDVKWWKLDSHKINGALKTTSEGLSSKEASDRLDKYGSNIFGSQKPPSAFSILMNQFKNWLVIMLVGAAILSFFLGEKLDGIVIIVLVTLSAAFGFFQEFKAQKVISDLKSYITNKARVKRDGKWIEIDGNILVPGDLVEIRIGDKIPADIRLSSVDNLNVDESVLTGESLPVEKNSGIIKSNDSNPADIKNMVFMGTLVSEGRGIGIVVATGENTFFGKSAKTLDEPEPETDFQKQIRNFSLLLFRVVMIMTIFIFASNALLQKGVLESFLFALALAVGITPELLPAIITVTLSHGALNLAKKKVIVKRLISVEDFGNVDTICTDKTGTLTEGKFTLNSFVNLDEKVDEEVLIKGALCTSGQYEKTESVQTSPVDMAILESSFTKNLKNKLENYKVTDENVFDYKRKRMSVLINNGKKEILITKGAYESVLSVCRSVLVSGNKVKMEGKALDDINTLIAKYEAKSFRIIAVSEKVFNSENSSVKDEKDMTLVGLLLFQDPIKESAKDAIKKFSELGVSLKVLSGDSLTVTNNIAIEAGITFNDDEIISGEKLDSLSETEFDEICKKVKIFARVTPDQKYKIVRALNYEGHIVGYMGDGVNDVAALRAADVGISVDTGVDIAKDAADIILLEKDLKILSEGIQGGRRTFGNIMKYILNTISANYGNMFTVAAASVFIKFIPLLPSQILLNNFISDIPLFAIATDNVDRDYVKKPKKWNISYIKDFMIFYGLISSVFDMILILPMLFILKVEPDVFRTAWFIESSISEMIITFAIRTRLPFFKSKPSRWLLYLSIVSIMVVASMPFLQLKAFSFVMLPPIVWLLIIIDLICYFMVVEVAKKNLFDKFEVVNKT
jgi:P-type Mg2+ transporter